MILRKLSEPMNNFAKNLKLLILKFKFDKKEYSVFYSF